MTGETVLPDRGRAAVAGVSSFGISGSNAHTVLVQAPDPEPAEVAVPAHERLVLAISARSQDALRALAVEFGERLGACSTREETAALCSAAARRRAHHAQRLAVTGDDASELAEALLDAASRLSAREDPDVAVPRVAFVFPGQGAQWVGMGRELLGSSAAFRSTLEACDAAIATEAGWSLLAVLTGDDAERLEELEVVQPALWAMQVSLAAHLRSWGIVPDVVIGHSMGEVAGAHVCGALDLAGAAAVICRRSRLASRCSGDGAMAVVELTAAEAAEAIHGREDLISVAAHNSPRSTVLSGEAATLATLLDELEQRGVACRLVRVDFASHSAQMDPIREELLAGLDDLKPTAARIPMRSTVLGRELSGDEVGAGYWADNIRQPVLFSEAVQAVAEAGTTIFVEVSPHPIITSAVNATLAGASLDGHGIGSLVRDQPERSALLDTLAELYSAGVEVDWPAVFPGVARHVDMPTYPWQHERFWFRPSPVVAGNGRPAPAHPLLGTRVDVPGAHRWEGALDRHENAYLDEHRVQGKIILPGTAYLELVHAAARVALGDVPITVSDVRYETALFLGPSERPRIAVQLDGSDGGALRFDVSSRRPGEDWQPHASGTVRAGVAASAEVDADAIRRRCPERIDGATFYAAHERRGNHWGAPFQALRELWRRDGEALAALSAPAEIGEGLAAHNFHPALLDACGQSLAATLPVEHGSVPGDDVFVLGGIDEIRFHAAAPAELISHAVLRPGGRGDSLTGDVRVADIQGRPVAELLGLRLQYLDPTRGGRRAPSSASAVERTPASDAWLRELVWERCPVMPRPDAGARRWLLVAATDADAEPLRRRLPGHVAVACPGSRLLRRGERRFAFDPADARQHDGLLAAAAAELPGSTPLSIVEMGGTAIGEHGAAERRCLTLAHLVRSAVLGGATVLDGGARLSVLTRAAHPVVAGDSSVAPDEAAAWGLCRVIAREHPDLECALVDMPGDAAGADLDVCVAHLISRDGEDQVAVREGSRFAARLVPFDARERTVPPARADAAAPASPPRPAGGVAVHAASFGSLDDVTLRPAVRRVAGPGEVEVEVAAAALNFRDVMLVLGIYPGQETGAPPLGWECAGTITAVGSGVGTLAVGDEVVAVAQGALASHVVTPASLVALRPSHLTPHEAATIPIAYITALYGLCELARLKPGERVLVHAATGGVGLAAVRIAQGLGAEVLATAGTPQKRALLELMGIRHVADSRSAAFADALRAATGGRGVDVVLNTLSGEAAAANWALLAPYGRYIELAKRDILGSERLALTPFARNLSYCAVDIADMVVTRPERAGALLHEVVHRVRRGELGPLPYSLHRADAAADAFHDLAGAQHIGKVVVSFEPAAAASSAHAVTLSRPAAAPASVQAAAPASVSGTPRADGELPRHRRARRSRARRDELARRARRAAHPPRRTHRARGRRRRARRRRSALGGSGRAARMARARRRSRLPRARRVRRGGDVVGTGRSPRGRAAGCAWRRTRRGRHPVPARDGSRARRPRRGPAAEAGGRPLPGSRLRRRAAGLLRALLVGLGGAQLADARRVRRGQRGDGRRRPSAAGAGAHGHERQLGLLGLGRHGGALRGGAGSSARSPRHGQLQPGRGNRRARAAARPRCRPGHRAAGRLGDVGAGLPRGGSGADPAPGVCRRRAARGAAARRRPAARGGEHGDDAGATGRATLPCAGDVACGHSHPAARRGAAGSTGSAPGSPGRPGRGAAGSSGAAAASPGRPGAGAGPRRRDVRRRARRCGPAQARRPPAAPSAAQPARLGLADGGRGTQLHHA